MSKKRILTGDNTTGKLHIGHYVGSLDNRVRLQDEYETFIIAADMHALAYPKYIGSPEVVRDSVLEVTMDNLAVGLDPEKVTFFYESGIPEIYELGILFSMIVSHSRVMRNPTIKDEIRDKSMGENYSLGFINFPVLMAADILCVKADLVPIGEDQLPHLELTKEIARKFNSTYGEVLVEPEALIGNVARLVGTDGGAKMTKSLNNAIFLGENEEELKEKVMNMYTDPKRIHPTDPGTVKGNPVFEYHDVFNTNEGEVMDLKSRYEKGQVGDVEVKESLYRALNEFLAPIREKREHYEESPDEVREILHSGTKKTREIVRGVLAEIKDKMKLFVG
jgi:tryptophanyl-tRNA synthetase